MVRLGPFTLRGRFYRPWWRPWLVVELGRVERRENRWRWLLLWGVDLASWRFGRRRPAEWNTTLFSIEGLEVGPFYVRLQRTTRGHA